MHVENFVALPAYHGIAHVTTMHPPMATRTPHMASINTVVPSALALALALSFTGYVSAQTTAPAPATAAKKPAAKPAAKAPAVFAPPAADNDQVQAADRVYYGVYDCEFKQTIEIVADTKYPSYVDVKHQKSEYLMKPVVSTTGAVRLEDTRGEILMVQIANKSMLLNVKTGHRLVDDCVSPKQRELIAAAQAAKAAGTGVPAASMFTNGGTAK
jgi:hypothetical protein